MKEKKEKKVEPPVSHQENEWGISVEGGEDETI
jgi:hypothetical protein